MESVLMKAAKGWPEGCEPGGLKRRWQVEMPCRHAESVVRRRATRTRGRSEANLKIAAAESSAMSDGELKVDCKRNS